MFLRQQKAYLYIIGDKAQLKVTENSLNSELKLTDTTLTHVQ